MMTWVQVAGAVGLVVGLVALGIWIEMARLHDCEALGHGWLYCWTVWGGR